MISRLLSVLLLGWLLVHSPALTAATWPPDSGIINVRDFGAMGDGVHDDTHALRHALEASRVDQGRVFWPSKIVFLPPGVYRVTDTLALRDATGAHTNALHLMGASASTVTIRLDSGASGFDREGSPKAVIYTSSRLLGGSDTAGGKNYRDLGEGNDAYGNYVENLTIDVGDDNPGAVALDYLANNMGAVRQVRLRAGRNSGHTGIRMDRKWPGPLLIDDLRVDGFAVGLSAKHSEYGITGDGLRFEGQRVTAIRNTDNMLALRRVQIISSGAATAVENLGQKGLIAAQDWDVHLSRPDGNWVVNQAYMNLHQVRLHHRPASSAAPSSGRLEQAQDGAYRQQDLLPGMGGVWQLSRPLSPPAWQAPFSRWANVQTFGARPNSGKDDGAAIQRALDSGAEVVYFPTGRYLTSRPLVIPAAVRRVAGMMSSLQVHAQRDAAFTPEHGLLQVRASGPILTIERLAIDHMERGPQLGIAHLSARTLVLQDVIGAGITTLRRGEGGGALFVDNTCCGDWDLAGQQPVMARQLNSEGRGVRVINRGAPLSILGIKVEQDATAIVNHAGAQTEVWGGLLYTVHPPSPGRPAFVNHAGGRLSVSYVESAYRPGALYDIHAQQLPAAQPSDDWRAVDLPARNLGRIVPGIQLPR